MTLLRQSTLVLGLLLGVTYAVVSYVESRRPLLAAPQVAEQECEAAKECDWLHLEPGTYPSRIPAPVSKDQV